MKNKQYQIGSMNFSVSEIIFLLILVLLIFVYSILKMQNHVENKNEGYLINKFLRISQICIDTPYYTKCITFPKSNPEFRVKTIKNYNSEGYIFIFKTIK